jgi:hypothetical protein
MRQTSQDELVDLIMQKLGSPARDAPNRPIVPRVPKTPTGQQLLLLNKPPYWEYLLFASVILLGKERLEPQWLDHKIRHVKKTGPTLGDSEAITALNEALSDIQAAIANLMHLFEADVQEAAFGPPGVAGTAVAIQHLGDRVIDFYDYLLTWASDLRGARTSSKFAKAFELAATMADRPLGEMRTFLDRTVNQFEELNELIAGRDAGERIVLELELVLTVDEAVVREFNRECNRLKK